MNSELQFCKINCSVEFSIIMTYSSVQEIAYCLGSIRFSAPDWSLMVKPILSEVSQLEL
jgi:hypothetical protein